LLIVGADGSTAAHTGRECFGWAGTRLGDGCVAGGNRLAGEGVIAAMAEAFEESAPVDFDERLVLALQAGQDAGGDRAGRQSAGLVVYWDSEYRYHDLRVDDHPDPVLELRRLLALRKGSMIAGWRTSRDEPLPPGWTEGWPALKEQMERELAEVKG
jgi:uncharacterized Ntn-hydrolase superfamily protein